MLFIFLGALATGLLDLLFFGPSRAPGHQATRIFQPLFQLATLLPLFAAGWRRMHDTGRPGWLLLLPLAVALGTMLLMMGGVMGFGMMHNSGVTGPGLRGGLAGAGYLMFGLAWIVQLVLYILIIWWLTRPSDPGPNDYGPPPGPVSSAQ
nr:DUF805 domain-containing protein [Roseovarius aestuariivivens]